jgi:hypothetical protein
MPKEYKACVKSEIAKGKSEKDAKRICAIAYYKRHGKTPQQAESTLDQYEIALFEAIEVVNEALGANEKAIKNEEEPK